MNTADIIKKRREELGLSQEELADKLGYKSRSSINKIELGLSDIPFSKIPLFAKALEIEPEILMGWEKNKKQEESNIDMNTIINGDEFVTVPLYSSISAGYGSEEAEFIERIAVPGLKNSHECFGVKVKGDSMEDKIENGAIIIVRRDSVIEAGQIGAFSYNEKSIVKQKKIYGKTIVLHSYNPKYDDLTVDEAEEFKEYGKVVMAITKF